MKIPATGWVGRLLRPQPAPIPWAQAIRAGVAVVTPVSIGMATGQLAPGLLCSIGALSGSMADRGGPYRQRLIRVCVVAVGGASGFLLGGLVLGHSVLTVLVVVLAGLISGLVSVLGNTASVAGLQFLLYVVVASGISFGPGPLWLPPVFYLAGAAWALLLSLSSGIGRVTAPERAAVADVYRKLAALLAAAGGSRVEAARQDLTAALNTAYDAVVSARATVGGHDPRFRRLVALLNGATPVVEATLTLIRTGQPVPPEVPGTVAALADAVLHRSTPRQMPELDTRSPAMGALDSGLRAIVSLLAGRAPGEAEQQLQRPSLRERMLSARDALASGHTTWLSVLRLVLCLGVAEAVSPLLGLDRPYWVALTVAVALKPDFGSVFARAIQRGLGTVVGVLIGSGLLVLLPFGAPILVAIAVFAAMLPITRQRNYGMFATFLTPVIVLLLDLVHRNDQQLVLARLIDTLLGCAIVLVVGYLPWPSTWRSRSRIGERVADVTDDVLAYLRVALGPDRGARAPLRRHTYRRLSDLRTVFQQSLAEPPPVSTQASAWWPAIVALERLTDAITAAVVHAERGGPSASASGVQMVMRSMEDLAAAVRQQRRPRQLPLPEEEQLAGVVSELNVAHSVLSGPSEE